MLLLRMKHDFQLITHENFSANVALCYIQVKFKTMFCSDFNFGEIFLLEETVLITIT